MRLTHDMHAMCREWLTTHTAVTYLADKLVRGSGSDAEASHFAA